MLNTKLKYVAFFLILMMAPKGAAAGSEGILLGLTLEDPIFRKGIGQYILEHNDNRKLVIGAGHIYDRNALHPIYQDALAPSMQGGDDFHKHEGWYTFSAETDDAFGSDMVGNIRKPTHQLPLFFPDTWNLIWDESYHPGVLSAPGLFSNIFASLKMGGIFIFPVSIRPTEGFWITGYPNEEMPAPAELGEQLAYGMKFESLAAIRDFTILKLTEIGFSAVELHESPSTIASKDLPADSEDPYAASFKETQKIARDTTLNPALSCDPIFAHAGLSTYYVIAKK